MSHRPTFAMAPTLNFSLDLLATRSFPRIAAVLRSRSAAILQRWDDVVREVLPNADKLTRDQLRDSLPEIMEQIARSLASDQPGETFELIEMTKPHGATRFHQQYSIRELVSEYRMWRRILIEEIGRGLDSRPDESEIAALNMAIDIAVEGGVLAYVDHQRDRILEATEIESRYVSFLSHDLRNHLNHASLILQLHAHELEQTAGSSQAGEDLKSVQRSMVQTMEGMERLLQAERLRKGVADPKREEVDLRALVSGITAQMAAEAQGKGLQLRVDVPEGLTIRSDPQLLGLILQNLLGNAIKYSQHGTVTVGAEQGGDWALWVNDEGPGIAPEKISCLFKAFSRGETHGQPGMGLGLSIAAAAAKAIGGELKVESKLGQGSTFRLTVPQTAA